ncbi:anaerobic ribonucleoside-triphosphate reductase activating protein [Dysgonomonas alginatilytica]|uniref:Anaerobic ribonucleoside-triphosphate reductase-activating protein n=1 Tax=Dysgonomonas alginatilytica TaxID=1605892 RepID=A0A2V3PT33_9BACT|nr:anaerobic ribonucleoside-triphosphate reductase activating protein [Dysgonomonas alginatilytica]PXV65933.1 anaerobic ribonucleoside-triphosphate reductase activating protein [Dysgonomonas alginatilytica]
MFKDSLHILKIYEETISDGEGLRYSIYLSGCKHHCKGCHNESSWNPNTGTPLSKEWLLEIIEDINSNPLLDGITISGGDPFFYPQSLVTLLKILKEQTKLNIWCYTGYTYEEILAKKELHACLTYIDVLVDGRFMKEKYSPSLAFRGSINQRIIKSNKLHPCREKYSIIDKKCSELPV